MKHKAVFLDRDGTIIRDTNYLKDISEIVFYKGAAGALKELRNLGFKLVVISNQSGIARGLFTARDVEKVNAFIQRKLALKGARIDRYYYCPHITNDRCGCRKPKTGMLKKAARDLHIDIKRSFIIGDKLTDLELGRNACIPAILVRTGRGVKELKTSKKRFFLIARNLKKAVEIIRKAELSVKLSLRRDVMIWRKE